MVFPKMFVKLKVSSFFPIQFPKKFLSHQAFNNSFLCRASQFKTMVKFSILLVYWCTNSVKYFSTSAFQLR